MKKKIAIVAIAVAAGAAVVAFISKVCFCGDKIHVDSDDYDPDDEYEEDEEDFEDEDLEVHQGDEAE